MVKEQLILHASMDLNVPFLDGFFFYCVVKRMNQHLNRQEGKEDLFAVSPEMVRIRAVQGSDNILATPQIGCVKRNGHQTKKKKKIPVLYRNLAKSKFQKSHACA